jgi:hypothetical protein
MTMNPRPAFAVVALLAAGPPLPAQTSEPGPRASPARAELEDLRTALETAIGRPGRMGLAAGGRAAGRVYRLKGYGAVIVLAPRTLPAGRFVVHGNRPGPPAARVPEGSPAPRVVITVPEGTFDVGMIDLGDLERQMEEQMAAQAAELRDMESAQREWTRARVGEMRQHLRLVEEQAEAFRLEAERARRKAEREVRTHLTPPPAPPAPSAAAVPPAPPAPPAPVAPPVPVAPVSDTPFVEIEVPAPPEPPDAPPPPWRFWLDVTDGPEAPDRPEGMDAPDADALLTSVRERLVSGLDSYRRPLASLRPDEFVTVAVDLVPDLLLRSRPPRTLIVRVRAGDLQERRSGRLSAPEFRKRVEFEEN